MAGLVRYVGISGVGRRRIRGIDERVVPLRRAGPLRHDAEVREAVGCSAAKKAHILCVFMRATGGEGKHCVSVGHTRYVSGAILGC